MRRTQTVCQHCRWRFQRRYEDNNKIIIKVIGDRALSGLTDSRRVERGTQFNVGAFWFYENLGNFFFSRTNVSFLPGLDSEGED